MAMTPAATVAQAIVTATQPGGATSAANASAIATWTVAIQQIQAMLATASVSVDILLQPVVTTDVVPALGLISAAPGSPVTGAAAGTGTGACNGVAARVGGAIV